MLILPAQRLEKLGWMVMETIDNLLALASQYDKIIACQLSKAAGASRLGIISGVQIFKDAVA